MTRILKGLGRGLASLRLTLVLLGLGMILVFWGTLAQASQGLYLATEAFFHRFFLWVEIGGRSWPYFPAGYTIGLFLLANLVAVHLTRFQWHWRKAGIHFIHGGLILLLIGELATSVWQEDYMLRLDEGQTKNYAEAFREVELVLIDITDPEIDRVFSVRGRNLAEGREFEFAELGLTARIKKHFPNSEMHLRRDVPHAEPSQATRGVGRQVAVFPQPRVTRMEDRDMVSAYVELIDSGEESLGTWFLASSLVLNQAFTHHDRTLVIGLRQRRAYIPFSLELVAFTHHRYPGTDIPQTFSSELQLRADQGDLDGRRVEISMNQPFRHSGFTFYQSGFDNDDQTSILQVVRNPSRWIPYISCILITLGMTFQFGLSLRKKRRPKTAAQAQPEAGPNGPVARWVPRVIPAAVVLLLLFQGWRSWTPTDPVQAMGELPVLHEGRVKPLDTVARSTLLLLNARQRVATENGNLSPMEWLQEVLFLPEQAHTRAVFLIHHPEVLDLASLPHGPKRYTFAELRPSLNKIASEAIRVGEIPSQTRSPFEQAIFQLQRQLVIYQRLNHSLALPGSEDFGAEIRTLPEILETALSTWQARRSGESVSSDPITRFQEKIERYRIFAQQAYFAPGFGEEVSPQNPWEPLGYHLEAVLKSGEIPLFLTKWANLISAAQTGNTDNLANAVNPLREEMAKAQPDLAQKVRRELRFHRFAPFAMAMGLYLGVFLLTLGAWLGFSRPLLTTAYRLLSIAFVLHTLGLIVRMLIEGRPPVTNLYSSAVFIGWGTILFGLVVERFYRQGFATGTAALVGFCTLIIAHHLSLTGDTLEVMRAVLDSNFWLATHVIVITLGYSATFLAGAMGLLYMLWWLVFRRATAHSNRVINGLIYGILCFALLFSFVGTVLGGIWADQSWGRFWGWDPKENGALLIVLWNAIILHARMAGYLRLRGLACLAILGTIVTAWSWFGTNMLGIGLHSYGFMNEAFVWLASFAGVTALIALFLLFLPGRWLPVRN